MARLVRVDEADVRPAAQPPEQARCVLRPIDIGCSLSTRSWPGRQRVGDLLDERGLVDAVRDDPLDLVVVGRRAAGSRRTAGRAGAGRRTAARRRRAHPLGGVRAQQAPRAQVVVVAVLAAPAADVAGEARRAGAPRSGTRRWARIGFAARGERRRGTPRARRAPRRSARAPPPAGRSARAACRRTGAAGRGRSCRAGRAPGSRARGRSGAWRRGSSRCRPPGRATSGPHVVEDPLERAEVLDRAVHAPGLVATLGTASRRGRRRGCGACRRSPRSAAPRRRRTTGSPSAAIDVRQRTRVEPRSRSSRAAARETVTCATSCPRAGSSAPTRP